MNLRLPAPKALSRVRDPPCWYDKCGFWSRNRGCRNVSLSCCDGLPVVLRWDSGLSSTGVPLAHCFEVDGQSSPDLSSKRTILDDLYASTSTKPDVGATTAGVHKSGHAGRPIRNRLPPQYDLRRKEPYDANRDVLSVWGVQSTHLMFAFNSGGGNAGNGRRMRWPQLRGERTAADGPH